MTEYLYSTIWNMNGGPIPQGTVDALERAIEGVLRSVDNKEGIRLLYTTKREEKAQEVS